MHRQFADNVANRRFADFPVNSLSRKCAPALFFKEVTAYQ
jgi:hypothetical protein